MSKTYTHTQERKKNNKNREKTRYAHRMNVGNSIGENFLAIMCMYFEPKNNRIERMIQHDTPHAFTLFMCEHFHFDLLVGICSRQSVIFSQNQLYPPPNNIYIEQICSSLRVSCLSHQIR